MKQSTITLHKHFIVILSALSLHLTQASAPYKAVVVVPVADLVGAPIQTFFSQSSPEQAYHDLVVCGGKPAMHSCCPRLHQLLFNEIVTVIEEQNEEIRVQISSCFYVPKDRLVPQYTYWMLKQHVLSLQELEQKNIVIDSFPSPISFEDPESVINHQVVTLALPWHDVTTGHTFSAGTRFLKTTEQHKQTEGVSVHIFNPTTKQFFIVSIPSSIIIDDLPASPHEKIRLFVRLLTMYAHQDTGFIPYVLGGSSFIRTTRESYQEKMGVCQNAPCSYYEYNNFSDAPKPGFDCSNLITRVAQMAGIPFFFKNSLTIATYVHPLSATQQLESGDIFWKRGHVMVIADTEKHTIIEAPGYKNDSGHVHELPLAAVFKNIVTCEELLAAWRAGQTLELLGDDGSIIEQITDFKLLSLSSIMDR